MDFKTIIKRIDNYLHSDKGTPIIVDIQTRKELNLLLEHYDTETNTFVQAAKYCKQDSVFKKEEFKEELTKFKGNVFISGISSFLKLEGEKSLKDTLKTIVSTSISDHVVIITFQCKNYLKFSDPRIEESGKILILDGEPDETPSVVFISPSMTAAFNGCYTGFNLFSRAVEGFDGDTVYIATSVDKATFSDSLFNITQLNNGYDIIKSRDSRMHTVPNSFGTAEQWNKLLELMGSSNSITTVADKLFGSSYNLSNAIKDYHFFDETKKWIYYICLSVFGVNGNDYLKLAVNSIANYNELTRSIFRTIIHFDYNSAEFENLYNQRKSILTYFVDEEKEFGDYCKVVSQKGKDSIYYLTDLSQIEKERIINFLSQYGALYTADELMVILKKVYPDLADYLSSFKFRNELLDPYINNYKYQKLTNHIQPSFEVIVDEQATKHDFITKLKPRSSIINKTDVDNSEAYFVDALGVEYLGYIVSKCDDYSLSCSVSVCRAELPTLTCFNKEFVDVLEAKGCKIHDIKDLDEIKHHGKEDYDYEKVKTPIYLIKELSIIDDLIKRIRSNLSNGIYEKAIIVSDHGASRLAVIHETENIWSMATNGEHSGRCCPKNEIDDKPDYAIESDEYWVLANYDRFKGGRKANVEVHGGAAIEEVAVPIIEISLKQSNIEAFITEDSKKFTLAPMDNVILKIYVATHSKNIGIELNGKYYNAIQTENEYIYSVELSDIKKKGIYSFDIYLGTEKIAQNQMFEIKKKGMSENDLF